MINIAYAAQWRYRGMINVKRKWPCLILIHCTLKVSTVSPFILYVKQNQDFFPLSRSELYIVSLKYWLISPSKCGNDLCIIGNLKDIAVNEE